MEDENYEVVITDTEITVSLTKNGKTYSDTIIRNLDIESYVKAKFKMDLVNDQVAVLKNEVKTQFIMDC